MALKYCYCRYEHPHETEQFGELLSKLANYFSNKRETAYFIACGEILVNGRAFDALLLTPYAIFGIEFKNYASDGDIIRVIDNDVEGSWLVYHSNGQPLMVVKDGERRQLSVDGGKFSNPYKQAFSNRQKLRDSLKELGLGKSVLNDVEDYSRRVSYFVVFTKDVDLESKCEMLHGTKQWLNVTTNNKFTSSLDSKLKSYSKPVFSDDEILHFLSRWGFDDLRDRSEWDKQKYEIGKENPFSAKQNTTRDTKIDFNMNFRPSSAMQDMEMQRSRFMRKIIDLSKDGDLVFTFLMSFVMTLTIARLWWWENQKDIVVIVLLFVLAFWVGYSFFIRDSHKTRRLSNRGEFVDGSLQVMGVNKFTFGSVLLCHIGWVALAALLYLSADPLKSQLPESSDKFYGAFYAMLRLMCVLLKNCAAVFGSITLFSLLFRLLNLRVDTFHEKVSSVINCLTLMPCTRSDISSDKGTAKEYWDDLRKWFRTLVAMSAYVVFLWVGFTFLFDRELFMTKYRYWPLKQNVEKANVAGEVIPSDKPVEPIRKMKSENNVKEEEATIQKEPQKFVKVISLRFNTSSLHMRYGETYNLRQLLIIEPYDANEPLEWSVANSDYLSIDSQTGEVTNYMSGGKQSVVAVTTESQKIEASIMINSRE